MVRQKPPQRQGTSDSDYGYGPRTKDQPSRGPSWDTAGDGHRTPDLDTSGNRSSTYGMGIGGPFSSLRP